MAVTWLGLMVVACGGRTQLPGASHTEGPADAMVDADPDAAPDAGIDAQPDVVIDSLVPLELDCPHDIDDGRLPRGFVGGEFVIDGGLFVTGEVASWSFGVVHEKCDELLPAPRYTLLNATSQVTHFRPARPGSYHMVLSVTAPDGQSESCEFELPVQGRGLRVELCWDTSTSTDLDLALHNPFDEAPWFSPAAPANAFRGYDGSTCNVINCASELRGGSTRVDWGYPDSPLEFCDRYRSEAGFIDMGFCPNPRASTDNNNTSSEANGTAEVVQLDNPHDGERFRVMVQNYSNEPAEPRVYIYCGREEATLLSPGTPPNFVAPGLGDGSDRYGTLWRPADVEMWIDDEGTTVGCLVQPLYLNGDPAQGPYVTIDEATY